MLETPSPQPTNPAEVQAGLHAVAQMLRQADHLGSEARQALAELVDELGSTLTSAPVAGAELAHLTDSTTHLVQALREPHKAGLLAAARDRLNAAIVRAEVKAPTAAGLARQLVETLSNIGI
jgi:hypothetical protein